MSDNLKQQREILAHLQQGKELTTLYAREVMGIMHPGGRVLELRKMGYNIITNTKKSDDVSGKQHQVGEYILMTEQRSTDNRQQELFTKEV